MAWFHRKEKGIQSARSPQNDVPAGQWEKCKGCDQIRNKRELEANLQVCPGCGHHFRLGARAYFELLLDPDSVQYQDSDIAPVDPLSFTDRKAYSDRLRSAQDKSGLNDAVCSALGTVDGHAVSIAAMDFGFIGGSMGSVVGEVVARSIRRAVDQDRALIIVAQSGGARMMEGALSLMQMAKTTANLARLDEKGLPFLSVLTHPTTGGVTASFAMLGDINIAEPGALIGFAGPRVIRETIGQDLPPGFQRSKFLKEHGFVDLIVDRRELRSKVAQLLGLLVERP